MAGLRPTPGHPLARSLCPVAADDIMPSCARPASAAAIVRLRTRCAGTRSPHPLAVARGYALRACALRHAASPSGRPRMTRRASRGRLSGCAFVWPEVVAALLEVSRAGEGLASPPHASFTASPGGGSLTPPASPAQRLRPLVPGRRPAVRLRASARCAHNGPPRPPGAPPAGSGRPRSASPRSLARRLTRLARHRRPWRRTIRTRIHDRSMVVHCSKMNEARQITPCRLSF